jgi:hypothetical protein
VTFSIQRESDSVRASIDVPTWRPLRALELRLRLPRGTRITTVSVDGRAHERVDRATQTIDLSGLAGHLELEVGVAS